MNFISILLVVLPLALQAQEFHLTLKGEWTTVENLVQEAFFLTHSSGSMTLSGTCRTTQQGDVVVSDTLSNPPRGPFTNLAQALTAVSQQAPHLSWTLDKGALMRVSDDRVQDKLLHIVLHRVHFGRAADPNEAIRAILSAPEAEAFFKENHIDKSTVFTMPMNSKDTPRLSDDLRDVTVAEALDRVVRFFPGLWIYSECTSGSLRRVTVRGAEVGRPGGSPSGRLIK